MGAGTEMVNGQITSDGRSPKQLYEAFSVKKLQEFTGSESTDVYELFAVAVEIAKAELSMKPNEKPIPEAGAPAARPDAPHAGATAKAGKGGKRGRPKKGGDAALTPVPKK